MREAQVIRLSFFAFTINHKSCALLINQHSPTTEKNRCYWALSTGNWALFSRGHMMRIKLWARVFALIITLIFALGMLYLMMIGWGGVTTVAEEQPVVGDQELTTYLGRFERQPYPPSVMPFVIAVIILCGLLNERLLVLAWIGMGIMTLIGLMLIFGPGIICWGLVMLLTVPMSLIQWQQSGNARWLIVGMVGALLLIWGGSTMMRGLLGWLWLPSGVISALLLAWLFAQSRQQKAMMP